MDFELWNLPELGCFGDYLVFSWHALVDTLFQLTVCKPYMLEAFPCSGNIHVHLVILISRNFRQISSFFSGNMNFEKCLSFRMGYSLPWKHVTLYLEPYFIGSLNIDSWVWGSARRAPLGYVSTTSNFARTWTQHPIHHQSSIITPSLVLRSLIYFTVFLLFTVLLHTGISGRQTYGYEMSTLHIYNHYIYINFKL